MTVTHRRSLDIRQTRREFKLTNIFEVQGFGAYGGMGSSPAHRQIRHFRRSRRSGRTRSRLDSADLDPERNHHLRHCRSRQTESDASLLAGFRPRMPPTVGGIQARHSALDGTPTYSLGPTDASSFFCLLTRPKSYISPHIAQAGGVETFAIAMRWAPFGPAI